ncbi:MAG: hypothetical protein HQL48_07360 [Gammaproteobacteria bacterium]|nr:hypothetical protein [Gammaproteobacteria bacterium]
MSSHLEKRLEQDLFKIRNSVALQAKEVETAVRNSVEALQSGNRELATMTVLRDHGVNRTMRNIDASCHRFIALYLPSAGTLRLLFSITRVNLELERIGDYAVTIAREATQLSAIPTGFIGRELERISGVALLMLHHAAKAFDELSPDIAKSTILISDQIEVSLDSVYEALQQQPLAERSDTFALFAIFTQLKRVTDQAKNICEETLFAASGITKESGQYPILFVDRSGQLLSRLAVAIARTRFPKSGQYSAAGSGDATAQQPLLETFFQRHEMNSRDIVTCDLSTVTDHQLHETDVVIALQGEVEAYFPTLPFHTSGLSWPIVRGDAIESEEELEHAYRELASRIEEFMFMMRGDEAN